MSEPGTARQALLDWFAARGKRRHAAFGALVASLKHSIQTGKAEEAAEVLCQAALPTLDYTEAQSLLRVYAGLREQGGRGERATRLAVLGSASVEQLAPLIELYLFAAGVPVTVHTVPYGTFRQEILAPQSALHEARPDVLYLAASWRDLAGRPGLGDSASEVGQLVSAEAEAWAALWEHAHGRLGCRIVQDNFAAPPWRLLGNHERRVAGSWGSFLAAVNDALARRAPPYVVIHDADHLAASVGRWSWGEERFYHYAKMPCAPEHLVAYAHSVASVIAAQAGRSRKCLVLDLDGTLWGGVVADDGVGGIRLGPGDPEGDAFAAFQSYVKGLQLRGVLLAVCSKNDEAVAREPFEKHPSMPLRAGDFASFVANWADKATNLRRIAEELGIGADSLVFVDDNPAERALVRQFAPDVAVPELPEDPSEYIRTLEQHRYFQAVSLVGEDLRRTEYHRANAERRRAHAAASPEEFLHSLGMVGRIDPIQALTLERSAQLIGRSNQFNLTTRRHSAAELAAMMRDDHWITRTISLADRFGDNGLISVLLGRVEGQTLSIDTWLMSCRVLQRTVEQFLLNHLCAIARERGIRTIRGEYVPTPKNALVRGHYAELGFALARRDPDGHTWWELDLAHASQPFRTFVAENPGHA